jgi:hypothetical protein
VGAGVGDLRAGGVADVAADVEHEHVVGEVDLALVQLIEPGLERWVGVLGVAVAGLGGHDLDGQHDLAALGEFLALAVELVNEPR